MLGLYLTACHSVPVYNMCHLVYDRHCTHQNINSYPLSRCPLQVVQAAAGFKARIAELEASVQRLKDAAMERDREGKRGPGNGTGNGKAGRGAGGVKSDELDDL